MTGFHPYRKRKSFFLPIVIVLLAVFLSFSAFRNLSGLRSVLQAAIYPFQAGAVWVWKGVTGIPGSLAGYKKVVRENKALKEELRNLRPQLVLLDELLIENARLRASLSFKYSSPFRIRLLPAQVVGRVPSLWYSMLEMNQGERAGVKKDMPVIIKEGLVGRVVEVSKFSSKVMLLTDAESSVAALDSRSRDFGVVKGGSPRRLSMKYVDAGGDIKEGDLIVTSNISTIFPPGLAIGKVIRASKKEHDLFYHIEIKPSVDFSKIEEVFIIK